MASAGSPCAFRFSSATTRNSSITPSCISCGPVKRRDADILASSILGCYFSSNRVRKILKKYHQNTLQPYAQTVWLSKRKIKRFQASSAPLEEGITVHGMPCTKSNNDAWEEARKKLDASLDFVATDTNLFQALHETARMFQIAMEKQRSFTKGPWFAKAWLGIDHNAWIKSIAYQAAVHAFIQAALAIARRREGKSVVACAIVQQSMLHLCTPLKDSIRQYLSSRDPEAEEWLWYQQHPVAVANFTSNLEKDPRFSTVAILDWPEDPQFSDRELDCTLFMITLSLCATVMKLGPGTHSCSSFSVELAEETGRLMESFVKYSSIDQVYQFTFSVGLRSEFLVHFGPRAALDKGDSNLDEAETVFWIELVQKLLRGALAREGVRSKLSSLRDIEVLEQDLAVFGFFAALGRRARSFLLTRKIDLDDSLLSLLRYLEGGCVLFCPQLATLSTYELFVEVVSEELAWIPFFEETSSSSFTLMKMRKDKGDLDQLLSHEEEGEAVATVLNVCSYWVDDFMTYSSWIQRVKTDQTEAVQSGAVEFLSNIQSRLYDCIAATSHGHQQDGSNKIVMSKAAVEVEQTLKRLLFEDLKYKDIGEKAKKRYQTFYLGEIPAQTSSMKDELEDLDLLQLEEQLKSFDEDLQTVEEVLFKLEQLLKESELSSFRYGRVRLTAIRINLWKIRRLKQEAEALEVSLKHKAFLKENLIKQVKSQQTYESQDNQEYKLSSSEREDFEDGAGDDEKVYQQQRSRMGTAFEEATNIAQDLAKKLPFFSSAAEDTIQSEGSLADVDDAFDRAATAALDEAAAVSKAVAQFEVLRRELNHLDFRIRECAGETNDDDCVRTLSVKDKTGAEKGKVWEFFSKSAKKFKNISLDVLKGTQLLATDVVVALTLLKSSISGHELTERERKILMRTCTDLASVIPIGFLMLLPVTAVGHAAMLAAIQKYVPALIPSAYAPERLGLLKQLEHLRKMQMEAKRADTDLQLGFEGTDFQDIRGRNQD